MDKQWMRYASSLDYVEPASFLARLRQLEIELVLDAPDTPYRVKALRTNSLREARERRQAALFCIGMTHRTGHSIDFASDESHDYDFIARWFVGDVVHFATVQLKEVVPTTVNANSSLQAVVDSLAKYSDSSDLTVAIHLNQATRFDLASVTAQDLNLGSLWVFGATSSDQAAWCLWGNLLETQAYGTQYQYPDQS